MPDVQHLLLFVAAGLLLNLTPGPDVLYIVSNALRSGVRAGVVAGLGITAGCFVHVFAAAVGVGALLAASATAFTLLKWAGAAYLLWIGIKLLISKALPAGVRWGSRGSPPAYGAHGAAEPAGWGNSAAEPVGWGERAAEPQRSQNRPSPSLLAIFRGGFLTNVLNPKVAIFFLAFVPQFIAADAAHPALVFVALGTLFNINSIPVNSGWALAAAWMARRGAVQRGMHWLDRAAGAMFIAFGLKLAFTDNPSR